MVTCSGCGEAMDLRAGGSHPCFSTASGCAPEEKSLSDRRREIEERHCRLVDEATRAYEEWSALRDAEGRDSVEDEGSDTSTSVVVQESSSRRTDLLWMSAVLDCLYAGFSLEGVVFPELVEDATEALCAELDDA